jgi:hypothetical protein
LRKVARPLESEGDLFFGYSRLLVWPDVKVLGGLRATVTTPLRAKRLRRLQVIPFSKRSPPRLFRWVNAHRAEVLQIEPRLVDDGWCPEAVWKVGACRVSSGLHDLNGLIHVLRVERRGVLDDAPGKRRTR